MISSISGKIIDYQTSGIVIEAGGLGYQVFTPSALELGQEVKLYTHHSVKETESSLWGFMSKDELALFELLLSVSGVGERTAMSLMSTISPGSIMGSIIAGDSKGLQAPGIGAKTAERIVWELKSKIDKLPNLMAKAATVTTQPSLDQALMQEAFAALTQLGYTDKEVKQAIDSLGKDRTFANSTDLIKETLKYL